MKSIFLAAILTLAWVSIGSGEPATLVIPPETGTFKPGAGADLANGQCLTCHSVEYVVTQPRMPRAFWKASIEKMRAKFGAVISDDQLAPILDYLVVNYGKPEAQTNSVSSTAPVAVNHTQPAARADAKTAMIRRGCFNCHFVDKKLIGPAYKDVAAKYAGNPEATARIQHQILQGGSGQWGPIPMPPFSTVPAEELTLISDWILSQK